MVIWCFSALSPINFEEAVVVNKMSVKEECCDVIDSCEHCIAPVFDEVVYFFKNKVF